jgi:serine protease inhibitor
MDELMNHKSLFSIVALNLLIGIAICTQAVSALPSADDPKPAKSTDFAISLFKHEAAATKRNVLISPFSIYMALGMTANGASGETKLQMAQTLGVNGDDFKSFNASNHIILKALTNNADGPFDFANMFNTIWQSMTNTGGAKLETANALYADNTYPFKQSFLDLCQKEYLAESHNENFADPTTVRNINHWCDQKTHGKIKEVISQLTPDDKLVLLNSIYFKGSWIDPFKPSRTNQQDFKLLDGSVKQVPMMHKKGDCEYYNGDGFEAVALPYFGKRNQVMYIFLPAKGANFANFLNGFTAKNWKSRTSQFYSMEVILSIPKYKIECTDEFNKSLIAMGMSDAFSNNANFDALCAKPTKISKVIQKTYVEVDEAGTEAAAATTVKIVPVSAILFKEGPPQFTVDRPFVMALVDRDTNEILFLGAIVDPTLQ